jgi:hypothetical protein
MGRKSNFKDQFGNRTWTLRHHTGIYAGIASPKGYIELKSGFSDWTFAHELGHALNFANNRDYEKGLREAVGAGRGELWKAPLRELFPNHSGFWYDPGSSPPVNGVDQNFNSSEDFAESFAAVVLPADAAKENLKNHSGTSYDWASSTADFNNTDRGIYILSVISP